MRNYFSFTILTVLFGTVFCAKAFAAPYSFVLWSVPEAGTIAQHGHFHHVGNSDEKALKQAEAFVEKIIDEATTKLGEGVEDDALKAFFKKVLDRDFDVDKIARFSLGRYWRTASSAQQKEYVSLFRDMVVNVYAQRFGEYNGQTLEVRGARAEGSKDIIVSSVLLGQKGGPDVDVDWRVREGAGGRFKVIDVIVEGVSMALTQRSEFASVIQRGGGDVSVLIAHLQQ